MPFIRSVLVGLACALGLAGVAEAQTSPAQTIDGFFTARLKEMGGGAPSGAALLHVSPYLAPELVCLLGAAQRYSEAHAKALPGEKPPFVEGDLYSSHFEVPTSFRAEAPRVDGQTASVRVNFEYTGYGVLEQWHDDVKLRHINGRRWQIEDIAYEGDFGFGNRGSLRANLLATLSNPAAGSGWDQRELTSCEIPAKSAVKKAAPKKSGKSATKSAKKSSAAKSATAKKKTPPKK